MPVVQPQLLPPIKPTTELVSPVFPRTGNFLSSDVLLFEPQSERLQAFNQKLDAITELVTDYRLIGLRAAQAGALEAFGLLDNRERFIIKFKCALAEDPVIRLAYFSILNQQLRLDSQNDKMAAVNHAWKLVNEEHLPRSGYEVALLVRGLTDSVDQCLARNGLNVGQTNDRSEERLVDNESPHGRFIYAQGTLANWSNELLRKIDANELTFSQGSAIISDAFRYSIISARQVLLAFLDNNNSLGSRMLLAETLPLIDTRTKNEFHNEAFSKLNDQSAAERNIGALFFWGSPSKFSAEFLTQTIQNSCFKYRGTEVKISPKTLELLLIRASMRPDQETPSDSLDVFKEQLADTLSYRLGRRYDIETLRKRNKLGISRDLAARKVAVKVSLDGVEQAVGPEHTLTGRLWKRVTRELPDFLEQRAASKAAIVTERTKSTLETSFPLTVAGEKIQMITDGLNAQMIAAELFAMRNTPERNISSPLILASSAFSMHQGELRMLARKRQQA